MPSKGSQKPRDAEGKYIREKSPIPPNFKGEGHRKNLRTMHAQRETFTALMERIAAEKIDVTIAGAKQKLEKREAMVRLIIDKLALQQENIPAILGVIKELAKRDKMVIEHVGNIGVHFTNEQKAAIAEAMRAYFDAEEKSG